MLKRVSFIFRSGGKTTIEMETNSIDRAIANLMFSKMDLNIRDFPVSAPVNSKQGTSRETKPVNCSWNQPQGHDLPSYPSFRGDAEVPILGQRYLQTRANPGKHLRRNHGKSFSKFIVMFFKSRTKPTILE